MRNNLLHKTRLGILLLSASASLTHAAGNKKQVPDRSINSGLVVGHGDNGRGDAIWRSLVTHFMKDLRPEKVALLKEGTNVLAAYGNMEYHKKTKEPAAQMDLYIEGLRLSDILGE